MFSGLYKKTCLMKDEVRRKCFSKKIIVTLVTQGLPSSFLLVLLRKFTIVTIHRMSLRGWFGKTFLTYKPSPKLAWLWVNLLLGTITSFLHLNGDLGLGQTSNFSRDEQLVSCVHRKSWTSGSVKFVWMSLNPPTFYPWSYMAETSIFKSDELN